MYRFSRALSMSTVLLAIAVAVVAFISIQGAKQKDQTRAETTTTISMDGAVIPKSIEERVPEAATVAFVTVESVEAARWNTPDGKAPESIADYYYRTGITPLIFRPVNLRVDRYLTKPQPQTTLTIAEIGGEADGVKIENDKAVGFKPGMRAILFLARKGEAASTDWGVYSAYTIDKGTASSKIDEKILSVDELVARIEKKAREVN